MQWGGLTALVGVAVIDVPALGTVQLQDALLGLVRYPHLIRGSESGDMQG